MAQGLSNHNHDVVQQLSEKLDSVWRYEDYAQNAKGECDHCEHMWHRFLEKENEMIEDLKSELARHVKDGSFK